MSAVIIAAAIVLTIAWLAQSERRMRRRNRLAAADAVGSRWIERSEAEEEAARRRWLIINANAKDAGCKCGRPGTHVRRYGGTLGGVPSEVWTCEEHQSVNGWSKVGDGPWVPTCDVTPEVEAWRVP